MKLSTMIIIISTGFLLSCNPDLFTLYIAERYTIDGLIMSDLDSVSVTADNQLTLFGGGVAALRSEEITQLHADFTVTLMSGDGLRFSLRTVSNDFENNTGISFDYTVNGCKVKEDNKLLTSVDSIKVDLKKALRIHIRDEGNHYFITVDCDTVYHGITKKPATEYVIIRALNSTNAVMSGIKFENILTKN